MRVGGWMVARMEAWAVPPSAGWSSFARSTHAQAGLGVEHPAAECERAKLAVLEPPIDTQLHMWQLALGPHRADAELDAVPLRVRERQHPSEGRRPNQEGVIRPFSSLANLVIPMF